MSRLIDADKFKEWIDAGHLRNPAEQCLSELNVINMIDAQPTAYDGDKVVEQLEERKEQLNNDLAKDYYGIREYEHRSDEIDSAIELVKEGGKE